MALGPYIPMSGTKYAPTKYRGSQDKIVSTISTILF